MTTSPDTTWWPFVFDLDGTLCVDGRTSNADITDALLDCRGRHPLVFASARGTRDLVPVVPEALHDDATFIGGGNGAPLRTGRGPTQSNGFDAQLRAQLDALVDDLGLTYVLEGPWDYSSTGDPDLPIFRHVDPSRWPGRWRARTSRPTSRPSSSLRTPPTSRRPARSP